MPKHNTKDVTRLPSIGAPLVTYPISHYFLENEFQIYLKTVKIRRPGFKPTNQTPDRSNTVIEGFSTKARRNLVHTLDNAPNLQQCSQMVLTFHDYWPINGRQLKKYLNTYLDYLRREFPFLDYIWVLEFQTRGAPHIHLLLNVEPSENNRKKLGTKWNNLICPWDEYHRWWHTDRIEKNGQSALIPWKTIANYFAKYLDKANQKIVPDGYKYVGRFWGCSRNAVPEPETITFTELDEMYPATNAETGETDLQNANKFLVRTLGNFHERKVKKSWVRNTCRTTSIRNGAAIFRQTVDYLNRTREITGNNEPF